MKAISRWCAALALSWPAAIPAHAFQPVQAPPAVAAPAAPPRPAIWLLEDEDTKIYLFGTFHAFPADLRWRSPRLEEIIASADELVVEKAGDADGGTLGAAADLSVTSKPRPMLERVPPALRSRLRQFAKETGFNLQTLDRFQIWAAAFMIDMQMTMRAMADPAGPLADGMSGAELELEAAFRARERPISGVETSADQMAAFARMPAAAQLRYLEAVLDGNGLGSFVTDTTYRRWALGDVEAVAALNGLPPPDLYQALVVGRNRLWIGWLEQRLERPGVVLFAVGAGHLAGPDSVQAMLAERGLTATRID